MNRGHIKPVFAPPRVKPKATRNYAKSNYQAGGAVLSADPLSPPPVPTVMAIGM